MGCQMDRATEFEMPGAVSVPHYLKVTIASREDAERFIRVLDSDARPFSGRAIVHFL